MGHIVTMEEIHEHADEIRAIAANKSFSNVRVFGSVARGEADSDSDLDFLVTKTPGVTTLLSIFSFQTAMEIMFDIDVDVFLDNLATDDFSHVLDEAIAV